MIGFITIVLFFVGIPCIVWYFIARAEKADNARIREASMAYLRNHGGSAVGLEKFLLESKLTGVYEAKLETELALAQFLKENPVEPADLVFPREDPPRSSREKQGK